MVSTYGIIPDIGIAIDVCHAETPGVPDWKTSSMGKGPALTQGANIHPKVYQGLERAAKELGIPVQPDVAPAATGTDAVGYAGCSVWGGSYRISFYPRKVYAYFS